MMLSKIPNVSTVAHFRKSYFGQVWAEPYRTVRRPSRRGIRIQFLTVIALLRLAHAIPVMSEP